MYNTMLIVDDNKLNREILSLLFKETYTILEAENGQEAFEILEGCSGHIDIVLLDLVMPDISGIEILRARRNLDYFKEVPVIVITASDTMNDQIIAFDEGAEDFIVKPFIPEVVLSRVNNVMSAHKRIEDVLLERRDLKAKSEIDQMTGLYNKVTTEEMCQQILRSRPERLHALFVIDIDDFKKVNDTKGHLAGDRAIKVISEEIIRQFRSTDIVGRVGGDEFAILMSNVPTKEIARQKARDILREIKYKSSSEITINISVSVGISFNDNKALDYNVLFEQADHALYDAKKEGKGKFAEYGIAYQHEKSDKRATVLLYSDDDRKMCSEISDLLPKETKLVEVMNIRELVEILPKIQEHLLLAYINVSSESDDGKEIWGNLKEILNFEKTPVLAICKEGNMKQYKEAVMANVQDIISVPFEIEQLKRCIWRNISSNIEN